MNRAILDKELENIDAPGLGVIIYKGGEEVYSKFLGKRDIKNSKPVTRNTRFRVASVSKMFTIFSVMQLVEQGKINLDDDASDYLGFELRNPNFPQKKNYAANARKSHVHTSRRKNLQHSARFKRCRIFFAARKILGGRRAFLQTRQLFYLLQFELRTFGHDN